jgi:NodT family efflux transporter outer membrane factor (OMF) lipoprotein
MAPKPEYTPMPDSYSNLEGVKIDKGILYEKRWWEKFNDKDLNRFVDSLVSRNLDIKIAIKRYESMEALFDIQKGSQYPAVTTGFTATATEGPVTSLQMGATGPEMVKENSSYENFRLRGGVSYELDLWGKIRSKKYGAFETLLSSKEDMKTIYLTIISSGINLYYDYLYLEKNIKLLEQILAKSDKLANYNLKRYTDGVISKNIYNLTITNRNGVENRVKMMRSSQKRLLNGISILLGEYNSSILSISSEISFPFSQLEVNSLAIPSEVLKRRSDINSAYHKMESSRYEVGAVKGDLFPSIKLSFNLLSSVGKIEDLFEYDNLTKSISGDINQVLFAGGSKMANLDRTEKLYYISLLNYRKAVISGFNDIKNSFIDLSYKDQNYRINSENYNLLKENSLRSKSEYLNGINSYTALLNSEISLLNSEIQLLDAEKGYIQSFVLFNKALGGEWL